ncbi:hypothetical protein BDW22DRAFT_1454969 [Trametopsis cervina]|nr:hypothetical protein BDW22DRAFT_1454969 [Trametopsis cervina]
MARGASPPLPKVSFTKVHDEFWSQPAGVADLQARSYGYNDGSNFRRPEHYIRYIEPLESDLAQQVEYDMDEQDREWLDSVNVERRKEQLDKVTCEVFEIVMDRLEKEWFDLTKNIPKPDLAMPSEDSTCAICDDSEGENTNAIVFCDGCNLAVHQDCYGVPYIPEGQWLCRKCTVSPENPVSCILCPNEGGAFKQTVQGDWVHLLCAIWVPEVTVANDVFMEPVTGIEGVLKARWKLRCSLCDIRMGAPIQCIKSSCSAAFHVTCARKEKLLMPMKATQGSEAPVLACYCERHLPREQAEARVAAFAAEMDGGGEGSENEKSSKTARAYAKTYKLGPPLVPKIIVDRIMQYIGKVSIRQKREFVVLVCKYWSLKREARRGAPLLKRLHLEPWTAAGGRNQNEEEKVIKLEFLKKLKVDLDRVRTLADLSKKREVQKFLQTRAVHDFISRTLLSYEPALRNALEKIVGYDRQDFFKTPVSKIDVPDYYDIIKQPICWNVIEKKLDNFEYTDLDDFKNDIYLVLSNAMLYNRPDTQYYRAAQKIKAQADKILAELDEVRVRHPGMPPPPAELDEAEASSSRVPLGDLEPPLEVLQQLFSQTALAEGTDMIIEPDPVTSLFSFEFAKLKPPPTPPPLPPPKIKRDRRADRERARLERMAMDVSIGSRTRKRMSLVAETNQLPPDAPGADHTELPDRDVHPERKGKKTKVVLPGQADVPPVVDGVDNQRMFSMFDVGWILPDGKKRGGRSFVERQPKKSTKPDQRERSLLSTEGTAVAADENAAGPSTLPEHGRDPEHVPGSAVPMDVDQPGESNTTIGTALPIATMDASEVDSTLPVPDSLAEQQPVPGLARDTPHEEPKPNRSMEPPAQVIPAQEQDSTIEHETPAKPVKKIVVDVLDTPATRREKNQRKKAERLRRTSANTDEHAPEPGPSMQEELVQYADNVGGGPDMDIDANSELTSLSSDSEINGEDEEPRAGPSATSSASSKDITQLGKVELEKGQWLEEGTLVWAKASTFPWWPAVVMDADSASDAPPVLLESTDPQRIEAQQLHLVRFYDGKEGIIGSWNYVPVTELRMFGEIKELDEELTSKSSKMQRWKNEKARAICVRAYNRALAEMDIPIPTVASNKTRSGRMS